MYYIAKNKEAWNAKTPHHLNSAMYNMPAFLAGENSLNDIELELLGDVNGKSLLHLQCHFGQDTLSLARMGAKVTGIDLSEVAIAEANKINGQLGLDGEFISCNIYDLPQHLDRKFDIVFTSYGTIGWLHDLDKWAKVIAHFLKPGSLFIMAEFHPLMWMFDNEFTWIEYRYFRSEPIIEITKGTYADKDAPIETETVSWNHGIAEILTALIDNGLQLKTFREYDYSPYDCFSASEKVGEKMYRVKHLGDKIPMVYALQAVQGHKI
jgi:2-polyprenyl-3-methyl-5-hydroxy-6-metoxy-1,4-benzoquinol methylase